MLSEWKKTSTVGVGGRIELTIPELQSGEVVEVLVRVDDHPKPSPPAPPRPLGFLKGKIHVAPDFDAPLEDFQDYT